MSNGGRHVLSPTSALKLANLSLNITGFVGYDTLPQNDYEDRITIGFYGGPCAGLFQNHMLVLTLEELKIP